MGQESGMKWMEVIKVRTAGTDFRVLKEFLLSVCKLRQMGLSETRIYRHATLKSDWTIHLYWETEEPKPNGSGLALHLTQAAEDFGLIDHTVWRNETETIES